MRPDWISVKKNESVSLMRAPGSPAKTIRPRQERAQRTRSALLEAVEHLVAAEGADAVTTTRIASETGVSVGTIYRYFVDRDALLLATYDRTVARIVARCRIELEALDPEADAENAARAMLRTYLATAESIPAHAGLLAAMRSIRVIEADQHGSEMVNVAKDLLAPFLARFSIRPPEPGRLDFLALLLGTLVDLYLMTEDADERARLREEIEAHMLLALRRLGI